jgi:hypothetical protein
MRDKRTVLYQHAQNKARAEIAFALSAPLSKNDPPAKVLQDSAALRELSVAPDSPALHRFHVLTMPTRELLPFNLQFNHGTN